MRKTLCSCALVASLVAILALGASPAMAITLVPDGGLPANSQGNAEEKDPDGTKEGAQSKTSDSDHDGDAGNTETTYTEDNDTNDGGTGEDVADDGDNYHPSGKDRSVESGSSTANPNQGKSESDPDDDGRGPDRTNGGYDKPNGTGGLDKADQDGNNGCGNDDDFEDDNEGWCGKRPEPAPAVEADEVHAAAAAVCPADTARAGQSMEDGCGDAEVLGRADRANPAKADDSVLGTLIRNAKATPMGVAATRAGKVMGAVLPFTGAGDLIAFLGIAVLLIAAGAFLMRKRNPLNFN